MKFSKILLVAAAMFASTAAINPSYACINGSMKCLTHMVYVCQGGWWVITQGVCHTDETPEHSLLGSLKLKVNYSKPAQGAK